MRDVTFAYELRAPGQKVVNGNSRAIEMMQTMATWAKLWRCQVVLVARLQPAPPADARLLD
jgi:hypothetical protein